MSGTSLAIAPFRADEYSQCYESLKNWGFCPGIINFANTETFGEGGGGGRQGDIRNQLVKRHKTIYNKSIRFEKNFDLFAKKSLKNESYRIFRTLQRVLIRRSSSFHQLFLHV